MKTLIALTISIAGLAGCAIQMPPAFDLPRPAPYAPSMMSIKASLVGEKLSVGNFTRAARQPSDRSSSFECGGVAPGPIKTEDGGSLANYVRGVVVSELVFAGAFDETARTSVSGSVDSVDIDSMGHGLDLQITFRSSNGATYVAKRHRQVTPYTGGVDSCRNAAQGFPGMVQDMFGDALRSPGFLK